MMVRMKPVMQVASGEMLDPDAVDAQKIHISDIAASLSKQCRYNGHTRLFYSVAEHSVLICRWLADGGHNLEIQRAGLMHDAQEYVVGDVVQPMKRLISAAFTPIETAAWVAICTRFKLDAKVPRMVREADLRILMNEKEQAFTAQPDWGWHVDPLPGVNLAFWPPERAEAEFLAECARLGIK